MEEITLKSIFDSLKENRSDKIYLVKFKTETYVPKNGYVKELKCRFFISTDDNFCYKPLRLKRRGYNINLFMWSAVESIVEIVSKQATNDVLKNAKTLLKKIHPNIWNDMREELQKAVDTNDASLLAHEYMLHGKVKYRNVLTDIKKFNYNYHLQIKRQLEDAFNNKKEFRWSHRTSRHTGRDLSISVEMKEDGILRAWFSSEFMMCGNGDYYYLINPTTAIFRERD